MPDTLNYQGHVYKDQGEAPCPEEGWEDALVVTTDADGNPAYWSDGHLYVLDDSQSTDTIFTPLADKWKDGS